MQNGLIVPDNLDLTLYLAQILDRLDIAESSRQDYRNRISGFVEFAEKDGLNQDSFIHFKQYLSSRNDLGVSSKNKQLTVARILLKELHRIGMVRVDITGNVKSFRQSKKHKVNGVSENEITILLEYLQQLFPTPQNLRVKAILSLLTLQGLRQIEVSRLNVSDLDLVAKTALILGKGRDDRELIDLHPITVKTLRNYLQSNKIVDGALFVSNSNHAKNTRLTTRSIRRLVKDIFRQVGIEKNVHGLRHYFTTQLIKVYKSDLLEVARYTRHRSLEMLQVYDDSIKRTQDLPRFYETFNTLNFY